MLERIFQLKENNTNLKSEIIGGGTTFMTMAYVLVVIPAVMSKTGMDSGAIFSATAISAALATILMGLLANLPIALAPGLGINAFFAYTVVLQMGYSWEMALAAVFIEGIIFTLLSIFNIREIIVKAIPPTLKSAIGIGIGLFIATIGLVSSGVITKGEPLLQFGNISDPSILLTLISIIIIGALVIKKVPGGLLLGMLITTIIAIPMGVVSIPENFSPLTMPHSIEPIFCKMDFSHILSLDMAIIVFTLICADLFDTAGTLIAVCSRAGMMDKDGEVRNVKKAFLADALATTFGSLLGVSAVTSYVESAAGVTAGGRTGLTAVTTGVMFLIALLFAPVFLLIPHAATSAVLFIVGLFMMESIASIDFRDYLYALPAFVTIIFIPLSYSISTGIAYGFLSYVLIHIAVGRFRGISTVMYILAAVFVAKIILG